MRIGLVGVGRIGAFHAETLRDLEAVDDVVVTDLDSTAARAVAGRLGLGYAASPAELVTSGIDGLVVGGGPPRPAPRNRPGRDAGNPTHGE